MKVLKHRNLLGCLFAFILAMPLINIGGRMAYTIFNKNAKDSYSGVSGYSINYKYETNNVTGLVDLKPRNVYTLDFNNIDISGNDTIRFVLTYGVNFQINNNVINAVDTLEILDNNGIYITSLNDTIYFRYQSNFNSYFLAVNITSIVDKKINFIFKDNFTSSYIDYVSSSEWNVIESVDVSNLGTLDNVFDYSINKITESNNIGELKFFTWFADLFIDLDNSQNALYINFINWYFNYSLLVSAVYILFLALMWFIMWIRKLLERGLDFGNRSW